MIEHDMACKVCTKALNAVDYGGSTVYEHPIAQAEHAPVPVPAHQLVDVYRRCHICSRTEPLWLYRTPAIVMETLGGTRPVTETYSTHWQVCPTCAELIEQDDSDRLTHSSIAAVGWHSTSLSSQMLGLLHRSIVLNREPGRTLVTTSGWSPAPLKAQTLPKVRDRLARLMRGPVGLPAPLNHSNARLPVAEGLDQARLYWIDHEFTTLVAEVLADMPDTRITDRIVPARAGLLVWSTPVDERHRIAAASWTPHADGWQILCYRSLGLDLPATVMEPIRHDVGWLVPVHAVHVRDETMVNGDDPLAGLIASWLIIAQQLTHDEPTPVDPPIRKAYARARRPAPEVRLVSIRPANSRPRSPATGGVQKPSGRAQPDYRYWVSGHERNQAYGPGRSLRKTIEIDPFLKGPEDAPIKASTTVRVLGTARRRAQNDGSTAAES